MNQPGNQTPTAPSANTAGTEKLEPVQMDSPSGTQKAEEIQLASPPRRVRQPPLWFVLSNPQVYKLVKSGKNLRAEVEEFVHFCETENRPAFVSVYGFRRADLENRKVDRDSAWVTGIKFDIDGSSHKAGNLNAQTELHKLMDWHDERNLEYEINFSGSDGFGFYVPFPTPQLRRAYDTVSLLYKRYAEVTNVGLDNAAMMGTQQKFRIVNSRHQRSGLYAIPLTKAQARSLTMEQIKELAKNRVEKVEEADKEVNTPLKQIIENLDKEEHQRTSYATPVYEKFSLKQPLRPCTRFLIENKVRGWVPMSIIGFEVVAAGWTDEQIHAWSRSLGEKYSPTETQKHIDYIRKKISNGDLYQYGCGSIKRNGYCVNQASSDLDECRKEESSRESNKLKEQIRATMTQLGAGATDISNL